MYAEIVPKKENDHKMKNKKTQRGKKKRQAKKFKMKIIGMERIDTPDVDLDCDDENDFMDIDRFDIQEVCTRAMFRTAMRNARLRSIRDYVV